MPIALLQLGRALAVTALAATSCLGAGPLKLEVRETAGIQRFGYPLAADFRASGATKPDGLCLWDGKREVAAQFTRLLEPVDGSDARWSVDFSIDLLPGETRTLTIDTSAESSEHAVKKSGLRVEQVEQSEKAIRILHPALEFRLRDDLAGLLDAIQVRGDSFLVAGSPGLVMQLRDGRKVEFVAKESEPGGSAAGIIKAGPLAAAVQFQGRHELSENSAIKNNVVQSTVDLDFPLGKSWVRVDWQLDDPTDAVAELSGELRLRLDGKQDPPILADVGAAGWTYATLGPEDSLVFRARSTADAKQGATEPAWQLDRMLAGRVVPFARPPKIGSDTSPQGWGHLLDAKRATAIAVDHFAEKSDDTMEFGGQGRVHLRRAFVPRLSGAAPVTKRLTFWLHVVSSPPQRGAATSPQSMLFPPEVRVVDASAGP
jgi:hypothetical protein